MESMIGILLAGGRSKRLGIDKPTLELNGEMLVERHLRQLRAGGVKNAVIVCHCGNEAPIRARTGAQTVLQVGDSMSSAVLTGMNQTDANSICAVCVNDIVSDEDYWQLLALNGTDGTILIPTVPLERNFSGGFLELGHDNRAVRRIVEKPPDGCPAGAAANIMIHQIFGSKLLGRLRSLLSNGTEYETAINSLIEKGTTSVIAVPIRWWIAIKTPDDIARAQAATVQ
jgi:CTP:molybdopterin cytidylyltransferase MocA